MTENLAAADRADIRPVVRTKASFKFGGPLFGGFLLISGVLLFNALDARRELNGASQSRPSLSEREMISAPPPLALPPDPVDPLSELGRLDDPREFPAPPSLKSPKPRLVTQTMDRQVEIPAPAPLVPDILPQPQYAPPEPAVIERAIPAALPTTMTSSADGDHRVFAARLRNPALTVPQGTMIAAVLETALDSTRAGAVRAIVSRDVRSYDGSRVLIPRGSRLYGEYASEISAGQNRALIRWKRLTRPDAVIVELNSPAADPLGRAGVRGKVDRHFLERFGGAILQSILDIGVGVATRSVTKDTVVVGLPGSTQHVAEQQQQASNQVRPTLRVRQGTSVSVFVARDLDFSTVER